MKTSADLFELFLDIDRSVQNSSRYSVLSFDCFPHKLGKTMEGYPIWFVKAQETKTPMINLSGEFISVEYGLPCSIVDNNGTQIDSVFSIITLRSVDSYLCKTFLEIFHLALSTLPSCPEDKELALKIEGMLSVFSAMKRTPVHKLQGLWTELLVIESSSNPLEVAKAWHSSPDAKYDFTKGKYKVEVKSTSSEKRTHRFSLDQLNPTENSELLVASAIVRDSAKDENGGLSIKGVFDRICAKIQEVDVRLHIYRVICETLGNEINKMDSKFFDYISAKDSLAFYDYRDIPHIEKENVPDFVSEVKFSSELSHIEDIKVKGLAYPQDSLFAML